jgi:hypothetical protein
LNAVVKRREQTKGEATTSAWVIELPPAHKQPKVARPKHRFKIRSLVFLLFLEDEGDEGVAIRLLRTTEPPPRSEKRANVLRSRRIFGASGNSRKRSRVDWRKSSVEEGSREAGVAGDASLGDEVEGCGTRGRRERERRCVKERNREGERGKCELIVVCIVSIRIDVDASRRCHILHAESLVNDIPCQRPPQEVSTTLRDDKQQKLGCFK